MSDTNQNGQDPAALNLPPGPPAPPNYGAPGAPVPPPYGAAAEYGAPPAQPYGAQPGPQPYGAAPQPYGSAPVYGAPPAYSAAPGYGGYAAPAKTNTLAVVSFISSLVGLFIIPFIGSIVGVITGHMSLGQIRQTGEGGRGIGLAGTIIGWVGLGLSILGIIILLALLPFMFTGVNQFQNP